jgi:hypothetical protein
VPKTLQIFFDVADTVTAYFEPVGNLSFARANNFDLTVVAPTLTE